MTVLLESISINYVVLSDLNYVGTTILLYPVLRLNPFTISCIYPWPVQQPVSYVHAIKTTITGNKFCYISTKLKQFISRCLFLCVIILTLCAAQPACKDLSKLGGWGYVSQVTETLNWKDHMCLCQHPLLVPIINLLKKRGSSKCHCSV